MNIIKHKKDDRTNKAKYLLSIFFRCLEYRLIIIIPLIEGDQIIIKARIVNYSFVQMQRCQVTNWRFNWFWITNLNAAISGAIFIFFLL